MNKLGKTFPGAAINYWSTIFCLHDVVLFTLRNLSFCACTRKNAQVDAILMKTGLNNVLLPTLFIAVKQY